MSDHKENDETHDNVEQDSPEQEETGTEEGKTSLDESSSDGNSSDEATPEAAAPLTEAATKAAPVAADSADGHDDDGHDESHGHGLSHVASTKVLLGTFGALMVLTILTVGATAVDVGSSMNLLIAMIIATMKAGLVCMFFMHLKYDKAMHTVAFLSALLFALLFVSFALMDSSEYQGSVDEHQTDLLLEKATAAP